ncbi:MAG: hypothetical protein H7196_00185 [candidate division SR1 bacterium]|nr:hypothetical protein [candidate division SR1 bacterium]
MTESKMFIFFFSIEFCIAKLIQDFDGQKRKLFLQVAGLIFIEPPG